MAAYAWVEAFVECPACSEQLDDVVWLPWGGVLSYDIGRGPVYRVGSRLLWHLDDTAVTVLERLDVDPSVTAVVLDPDSSEPVEELSMNHPVRSLP